MTSGRLDEITGLMARYNVWANTILTDYVRGLGREITDKEIPGSFTSVNKTLSHILDAQEVWYQRLQGNSLKDFPGMSRTLRNEELYSALVSSSEAYEELEQEYSSEQLDEHINYATFAGISQTSRIYEILLHVFNHSMYHRGQCITMLRIAGAVNPPSTDLIRFLRLGDKP